jgi:hypothetical protein
LKKRLGQLKNNLKRRVLEHTSVDSTPSDKELEVSRKEMVVLDISWVNLMEGCIPVWETASTPFVGIGHTSKKIPNCPKSFLSLPWWTLKDVNNICTLAKYKICCTVFRWPY